MQMGNYGNIECELLTEEISTGKGKAKSKAKKTLTKTSKKEPEFNKELAHSKLEFISSTEVKNPSCNRFNQVQCSPPMKEGKHTWRIKIGVADSNLMVGVA
jgi:hypothetical protein